MLIDALGNALTPIYFKLRNEGEFHTKEINNLSFLFFRAATFGSIFIILISPWIITTLFNKSFSSAQALIPVLAISLFFNSLYRLKINEVFYLKKTKLVPIITLLTGLANFVSSIILIEIFGLIGAGLAMLISSVVQLLITTLLTKKWHPTKFLFQIFLLLFLYQFSLYSTFLKLILFFKIIQYILFQYFY